MPKKRQVRSKRATKKPSKKKVDKSLWSKGSWNVVSGKLVPARGRPPKVEPIFKAVGEKIPYGAIDYVEKWLAEKDVGKTGVYVAHDSMGFSRYVGQGNVIGRLRSCRKSHMLELEYFSFYIIKHERYTREIETALIRIGGAHLLFNERKKRIGIKPGSINDYEPGALFVERQRKRGKKAKKMRKRKV